ncbi:MAG: DNA polymerase III subunit gamma/tau [Ktedonobacteraceae bacterium]
MASQSLYRKWRSQTFGDLVGQESIVQTLKNALTTKSLAHAYLFTGPRGTGKTSMARLLAKTVNCEHSVNGEPCNQCEQCREITAGNSFNVIEIDAASNRGIDSIRDLREKVMMPPSTGKYKVYVLDEAHMLTTEAFNALLKTLEEPPDYAIFVMATTDVHKMLPTVLSRCQRFDFKRITTRQIIGHLKFVAGEEHVKLEPSAAELIARAAAGGMRDALSLLDQAIAYSGDEISLAQVQAMLGVADPRAIQKLLDHVAHLASPEVLHLIHELAEAGADLRQINIQVGEYWRALMLAKAGADVATILDRTEDETKDIMQMIPLFGLEELTEFARIFAQNDLMQKNQGTPQLGLELAFLQCIELHRRAQSGQPLVAPASVAAPIPPVAPVQPRQAPVQAPRTAPSPIVPPAPQSAQNHTSPPAQPRAVPVKEEAEEDLSALDDMSFHDEGDEEFAPDISAGSNGNVSSPREESNNPMLTLTQVVDSWERVKKRVKGRNQAGIKTSAYLNDYSVVAVEGSAAEVVVVIQAMHTLHYKYLLDSTYGEDIEWALSTELNQQCRVRLLPPGQTPPPGTASALNRQSTSAAAPVAPPQSAHRERPATKPPQTPRNTVHETPQHSTPEAVAHHPSEVPLSEVERPLARKTVVRENGHTVALTQSTQNTQSAPSLAEIQRKASVDPVVRKVKEMFKAEIKEIRPK